jgi:hypothetical protein
MIAYITKELYQPVRFAVNDPGRWPGVLDAHSVWQYDGRVV